MNLTIRKKLSLLLAIVPIVLISLNKISVDHLYDKKANWHRIINAPVERALSPILGEDHFIKRNYHQTPSYSLSTFLFFAMLYVIPIIAQGQLMALTEGILQALILANLVIFTWFFIEFLLIYNMVSSIPKVIAWGLIVITHRCYYI